MIVMKWEKIPRILVIINKMNSLWGQTKNVSLPFLNFKWNWAKQENQIQEKEDIWVSTKSYSNKFMQMVSKYQSIILQPEFNFNSVLKIYTEKPFFSIWIYYYSKINQFCLSTLNNVYDWRNRVFAICYVNISYKFELRKILFDIHNA